MHAYQKDMENVISHDSENQKKKKKLLSHLWSNKFAYIKNRFKILKQTLVLRLLLNQILWMDLVVLKL